MSGQVTTIRARRHTKEASGAGARGRGAPGRKRVPREVREREMIEAAVAVFGRRGYHGASMDEIAAEAGVTKPMLYAYFGSKDGLFGAVGTEAGASLRKRVRAAATMYEAPPAERLWRGLVGVFSFVEEHRELWSAFYPPGGGPGPGPAGAIAARGREAMASLMEELIAETAVREGIGAQAAGESAALAHALTASVLALADWWLDHPDEPKELQALRIMNLVWTGFEGMLEGRLWLPPE